MKRPVAIESNPLSVGAYTPGRRGLEAVPREVVSEPASAWQLLERSAERVIDASDTRGEDGLAAADLREALLCLISAIRDAGAGERVALGKLPAGIAARPLLERLRAAFVHLACATTETVNFRQVTGVVVAMEAVQEAIDDDRGQRFVMQLTGSTSLQALVEIAHDMRSPLGSILCLAERLRSGQSGAIVGVQERQLGLIYSAALGLSALASDAIELVRGGDRLVDHTPRAFSLAGVLESVLDIVHPMAEEKGLTLTVSTPEIDHRIGHAAALQRVLLNLITNALKFTPTGGVEVTVRQLDRVRCEISVRDTGRGIPPDVLATLFDPFRRVRSGGQVFSSAGLGLAICQKLVAAMGGRIEVESELERGTRFVFDLDLPPASCL